MNVFVTGGSRGIGRAIALRFARDGARRVAIGYLRNDRAAEETAEELRALGAEPVLVRGNITSERVLGEVAALGPLDVLVHNAATGVIRPALETEDKHWDWTARGIRVNTASGGVVETGGLEHFPNREEMLAAGSANPVGRLVAPDDIAGAVAFLCSADADMIRGQTIVVDGGFSLLVATPASSSRG